jgi:hypothetical protein
MDKIKPRIGEGCGALFRKGRGGQIRTGDLLLPKQARYRATLRPESMNLVGDGWLRQRSGIFSGKRAEQ